MYVWNKLRKFVTVKQFILLFVCSISLSGFSQETSGDTLSWEQKADTVIHYAKAQLGVTYKWAACSPGKCFDCSGFTNYAYKHVGVSCLRSSSGLANCGFEIPLDSARKGDMILFTGTNPNDKSVGHVGIILENSTDKLTFIHCSSSKKHFGVVITDYYSSGYPKRYAGVRRHF